MDKPTFEGSVLVWWDEGPERIAKRCHSFVKDGMIQFLGDCTHELANKTVELPDYRRPISFPGLENGTD